MKGLAAGLTFLNCATVAALLLGILGGGLNELMALAAVGLGVLAGVAAYATTTDVEENPKILDCGEANRPERKNRYTSIWFWVIVACFGMFAVRSFCWLLYIDGQELKIQSPNNLGDLALHVTFIRYFASGVPLWPDNPIYVFSHLRYPAGMDLFNALLSLLHFDLIRGLVWVGLLASVATCYAFYRWAGTFGIAGFLFNGGIVGFQILRTFQFLDYQTDKTIAWKSIPLTMFITQRGLLYAIPTGLLLLWHWREKFFRSAASLHRRGPLPFWVEVSLYASMPLFHFHTFVALTIVLVVLFAFVDPPRRGQILTLIGGAFVPAVFFVWLITEHFHAGSVVEWQPGWVMKAGDFAMPFFRFWWVNFGLTIPLIILLGVSLTIKAWRQEGDHQSVAIPLEFVLLALVALFIALITPYLHSWRAYLLVTTLCVIPLGLFTLLRAGEKRRLPISPPLAFVISGVAIFCVGYLFKLAPWGWDNLKIMIWGYFLVLPYLWKDLIARWSLPVRTAVCLALFGSGFVSLLGGLKSGGFGFADRGEVDWVGAVTQKFPVAARFAAYPTYNHPVLLQGRKVVLGYPGHLWTEGFDYSQADGLLRKLMFGDNDWREAARRLRVRYIFWGSEEKINYLTSTRPWEKSVPQVVSSAWGAIYDLEAPVQSAQPPQR